MLRLALAAVLFLLLLAGGWFFALRRGSAPQPLNAVSSGRALALAHAARGGGYLGREPQAAVTEFRRAHELDPGDRSIQGLFAFALHLDKNDREAIPLWRDLALKDDRHGQMARKWLKKIHAE